MGRRFIGAILAHIGGFIAGASPELAIFGDVPSFVGICAASIGLVLCCDTPPTGSTHSGGKGRP